MYTSVCTDEVSRVVEGRRNRCTRQRDADRRAIPLFFSRPLFCSSSSSPSSSLARPAEPLFAVARTLPLSLPNLLAFIAAATWLPVAERFSIGRWDDREIDSYKLISLDVDAVARVAPFLRFLFFDLLSCHRMIDDGFTVSYVTGSDKCTRTRTRSNTELTY